jgi:hypothetical protein
LHFNIGRGRQSLRDRFFSIGRFGDNLPMFALIVERTQAESHNLVVVRD